MKDNLIEKLQNLTEQWCTVADNIKNVVREILEEQKTAMNIMEYKLSVGFEEKISLDNLVVEIAYNPTIDGLSFENLLHFGEELENRGLIENPKGDFLYIRKPLFSNDRDAILLKVKAMLGHPEKEKNDSGEYLKEYAEEEFLEQLASMVEESPVPATSCFSLDDISKGKIRKNIRKVIEMEKDYLYFIYDWMLCLTTNGGHIYNKEIPEGIWREQYREKVNTEEEKELLLDMAAEFMGDEVANDFCKWLAEVAAEDEPESTESSTDSSTDDDNDGNGEETPIYKEEPEEAVVRMIDKYPSEWKCAEYHEKNMYGSKDLLTISEEDQEEFKNHASEAFVCQIKELSLKKHYIACCLDNKWIYSQLNWYDENEFLRRNADGRFAREMTPMDLAYKYFKDNYKDYITVENGGIRYIGKALEYEQGKEPAFCVDHCFRLEEPLKHPLFGKSAVINYRGKYYIDTYINKIHRTALLTDEDVKKVTTPYSISPFNLVIAYFGHEIKYEDNGCHAETEKDLCPEFSGSIHEVCYGTYVIGNPWPMPKMKKRTLPKGYQVDYELEKEVSIYFVRYNIHGGIFRKCVYGLVQKLHDEFVYKLFERNDDGRFTRNLTVQQVAEYYATNYILKMQVMLMGAKKGIPAFVLQERLRVSEQFIKDFEREWKVSVQKRHSTPFDSTEKECLKKDFISGMTVEKIKAKYHLKDYNAIYCVIERIKDRTLTLPWKMERLIALLD